MKTAVKYKFRTAFILLLAWSVMLQSVLPAYAGSNGDGQSTPSLGQGTTASLAAYSGKSNLCIFLSAGDSREFVFDTDELSGHPTAGLYPWQTAKWIEEYEDAYTKDKYSISKAYAQIFQRTMVSWTKQEVQDSILFMGMDLGWNALGGITYSRNSSGEGASRGDLKAFKKHGVFYLLDGKITEREDWMGFTKSCAAKVWDGLPRS